uniref:Uncharacterized protein n=1 Tax=viral metagenome TaxID=1070528 RepID=A0A6C0LP95_9ZZZZ
MPNTNDAVNFKELDLPIPENLYVYNTNEQSLVFNYLKQMSAVDKQAYLIAIDHLGSSFNIIKSNGYQEWLNKK